MRRSLFVLLLGLALCPAGVHAEEKEPEPKRAKPLTTEQGADAVLEAVNAKNAEALQALAKTERLEPWFVADELCFRGEHDAADAYARAAPSKAVEKLPAYVASQRGRVPDTPARETLATMVAALAKGDWQSVYDAARAAPELLDNVVNLRIAFGRGMALRFLKRTAESAKALTQVGEAAEALGWLGYAYSAFHQAGISASAEADWERVVAAFEAKIRITGVLAARRAHAQALHNLGVLQRRRGNYDEALIHYARSLKIKRDLGNKTDIARTLGNIGGVYSTIGDYDAALTHYAESLALTRIVGTKGDIASVLNNIGVIHVSRGDYSEALTHYAESLAIARALGDQLIIAQAVANIGSVQSRVGDYDEALKSQAESLAIRRALGHKRGIAETLINIAVTQQRLGRYAESLKCIAEALGIHRALGHRPGIALMLKNIGVLEGILGNHAEARKRLEESLAISRAVGGKPAIADTLDSLGVAQASLGDRAAALESYAESLTLRRAMGDKPGIASVLQNVGVAQESVGAHEAALKSYAESLEINRALGDKPGVAVMLLNIGVVQVRLERYDEARASYEEGLSLLDESPHRVAQARLAWAMAELHFRQGQNGQAVDWSLRSLAHVALLSEGLAEGEGTGARESFSEVFDISYRATLRAGDVTRLGLVVEHGRGGSLRESLGSRSALEAAVIPAELRRSLALARNAERRALAAYKKASGAGRRVVTRKARALWQDAQADVSRVAKSIEREAKHAADVAFSDPDDLQTIQGHLAPTDAIVYYALTSEEGIALVVRKDEVRAVALTASSDIAAAADALLDGDQHIDPSRTPALREMLVEPLDLAADVKRVLVSPMGRLGYVPFSLLFPAHEVAYIPSGTTYGLLLEEKSKRGTKILGLGDPDYQTDVSESAQKTRAGGATKLARLPATKEEIKAIADVRLLDKQATETGLHEAVRSHARWRAIHFACHGLVDAERPMLSALALTAETESDGFLTALEIFRMRMPADLVVMSACDTGTGKIYRTEGIVGLTRAFMFAGAPRVICSLWKVDDEATQALMVKFYELWNPEAEPGDPARVPGVEGAGHHRGMSTAAALKKAQEFIRGHDKWKHPYYWAAWALWGLPD